MPKLGRLGGLRDRMRQGVEDLAEKGKKRLGDVGGVEGLRQRAGEVADTAIERGRGALEDVQDLAAEKGITVEAAKERLNKAREAWDAIGGEEGLFRDIANGEDLFTILNGVGYDFMMTMLAKPGVREKLIESKMGKEEWSYEETVKWLEDDLERMRVGGQREEK